MYQQKFKGQKNMITLIAISISIFITIGLYGTLNFAFLTNNISSLNQLDTQNRQLIEIRKLFLDIRITANSLLENNEYPSEYISIIQEQDQQIRQLLSNYKEIDANPHKLIMFHKIRSNYHTYINRLIFKNPHLDQEINPHKIDQIKLTGENVIEYLDQMITINNTDMETLIQSNYQYYKSRIKYVTYILIVSTLLLVAAYGIVILKMRKAEKQTNYIAYYDSLTSLPNQTFLFQQLTSEIIEVKKIPNKKLFVFTINIDDFKVINNTLGYEYGDQLLESVALLLKQIFCDPPCFISRIGGDEFTILCTEVQHKSDIKAIAEKTLKLFQNPWYINNQVIYTGASIGISCYPADGTDSEILVQRANIAMNHAKEFGKSQYQFFSTDMYHNTLHTKEMVVKLRQALKNNEFHLYYQPQINSKTGEIVGVEALIRWLSPEYGTVPPSQFISIAEKTGLIADIGKWIIGEACRQNKEWQDKGYPPFYIAVNISAVQLQHKNFLMIVNDTLSTTGLDAEFLELEITESVLMESIDSTLDTLQSLKNIGVKISLDDFGTGFSSLNYLRKLPINTLKIDRTFIIDMEESPIQNEILESIISLAHKLKLQVIAEGVETQVQLRQLVERRCDNAQGYLISRPLPPDELEHILAQGYIDFANQNAS